VHELLFVCLCFCVSALDSVWPSVTADSCGCGVPRQIKKPCQAFLQGFATIISADWIKFFNPKELQVHSLTAAPLQQLTTKSHRKSSWIARRGSCPLRGARRTLRCVCVLQLLISGDTVEIDLKAPRHSSCPPLGTVPCTRTRTTVASRRRGRAAASVTIAGTHRCDSRSLRRCSVGIRRVAQDMRRHVKYSGGYSDRDSFIADFWKVTSARHDTALHCTALHCTALRCPALRCAALLCAALHGTALHCTALHGTARHGTALQCTAYSGADESTPNALRKSCCVVPNNFVERSLRSSTRATAVHCSSLSHRARGHRCSASRTSTHRS
jgi:hypothetical protein